MSALTIDLGMPGGASLTEQPIETILDEKYGIPMYPQPDGSIVIGVKTPGGANAQSKHKDFDSNLADGLPQDRLVALAQELLRGYRSDVQSNQEYIQTLADGIDLLGLKIDKSPASGDGAAPVEGMSTLRSHLLLEAVVRGQSNAHAELLPSSGPVKVMDDGESTTERIIAAEDLERAMNHYLKPGGMASEYYPDTDRLLWRAFFGGCCFRKVYHCPLRNRPVAESVQAENLIINWSATDITNAARVTHRSLMQNHIVRSMQRMGHWLDIPMSAPMPELTATERKEAEIAGKSQTPILPDDYPHTILEMYVDRDLSDFGVPNRGQKSGRPVPYRVVIEERSQVVLEIRRNWREGDDLFRKRRMFVKYGLIPGFGFYDYGFVHLLGTDTMCLTAMLRMTADTGAFASFPGFLYSSLMARQDTSVIRVPPGGGREIDTGGEPIQNMIMPIPYKDVSAGLIQVMQMAKQDGQRLGAIAELPVGEGRGDLPVGTTIALIEQATKVMAAVHKRLHEAQAEEFNLLKDLFREDPEALWRGEEKSPLFVNGAPPEAEHIIQALEDYLITPQSDPNVPSHMHRVMLAMAVAQLASANADVYKKLEVQKFLLSTIGISNTDQLLQEPGPEQQDPSIAIAQGEQQLKAQELALKQQDLQSKALSIQMEGKAKMDALGAQSAERFRQDQTRLRELAIESQDRAADRESRESVAQLHARMEDQQHNDNMQFQHLSHRTDQMRSYYETMLEHSRHKDQMHASHLDTVLNHVQKMTPPWSPKGKTSRSNGALKSPK